MLLGVDVGGTFTDAVIASPDGEMVIAKAPTTPGDEARGVFAAIEATGVAPGAVETFAHGTTVTTNALLEGRAAPTALLATEGFTDVVELGRQARADLYRLCAAHPAPLVPAQLRFAVDERCGPRRAAARAARARRRSRAVSRGSGAEAVAVVLLHSSAHPAHELAVGDALRARLPDLHISLSHEVSGAPREFERAASTEIDAALSPLLRAHLAGSKRAARPSGCPRPR